MRIRSLLPLVVLCASVWAQTSIDAGSPSDTMFTGGATTTVVVPTGVDATARYGNFNYTIPANSGLYLITFNWLEQTVMGPSQRQFRVTVNDQLVFDHMDLFVSCGYLKPCTRSVLVQNTTTALTIVFATQIRNAIVSSISVAPHMSVVPCRAPMCMGAMYLLTNATPYIGLPGSYVLIPADMNIVSPEHWAQ